MKRVLIALLASAPVAAQAQTAAPPQEPSTVVAKKESGAPKIEPRSGATVIFPQEAPPVIDLQIEAALAQARGAALPQEERQASAAPAPAPAPVAELKSVEEQLAPPQPPVVEKQNARREDLSRKAEISPPPAPAARKSRERETFDPFDGAANPPLSDKEKQGVAYGRQWKGNRDRPARGADGGAVYMFGATLPTIVCAPLYICDLVLQPGETVKTVNVGDSVRWQITPAEQGLGESQVTHIIIKPTDVGLVTNMVITTDRRAYVIKLLSRERDWMPRVSFEYPDGPRASWSAYQSQREQEREAREAAPGRAGGAVRLRLSPQRRPPGLASGQGLRQRVQDLHSVPP